MLRAFKYRIYPSKVQARKLCAGLEECRWLYNNTLAYRKDAWEHQKRNADWHETKRRIPILKKKRLWLKDVYSQVLQNVTERVDLAFKAFFRRLKTGETPGYPRFKGKGHYDSMTFAQTGFNLDGNHLNISKVGLLWVVLHRPIEGTVKTLTVRRSSTGKWYASFVCELPNPSPCDNPKSIGVDVGLTHFATLSNGERIENPRFFRTEQPALYGIICLEDLSIQNMLTPVEPTGVKNPNLTKSISDAAWNQFAQCTTSKAESAGGRALQVNPRNTSKMCSQCGRLVEKTLADRVHNCPTCGLSLDRDWNAAVNILRLGLQSLGNAQEARSVALCAQRRE